MRVLTGALVLLLIGCSRSQPVPSPSIFNPNLLNGVEDSVEEPTAVYADSVVFLGDSLTHIGWWRSYFPDVQTANQGVGGNTTLQVLDRLEPVVGPKPAKIFLLIGANDYNFGVDKNLILLNYERIVYEIRTQAPDTRLYVQLIMPYGPKVREYFPMIRETYKADILEINFGIAQIAAKYDATLLNTYLALVDENGDLKPGYTLDQIHLEAPGYEAWVGYLGPYVRE